MDKTPQLEHRFSMIYDDLQAIQHHIHRHDIAKQFEKPTPIADECWSHFANIEIACNLNDDECLTWKPFNPSQKPTPMTKTDLQSIDNHYFWVERPKAVLNQLLQSFTNVIDASFVHDACPSLLIENSIRMFLPNSTHDDGELFTNLYAVVIDEEHTFDGCEVFTFAELHKAVEKVEDLLTEVSAKKIKLESMMRMVYDQYLFAKLLAEHDADFAQLPYDEQWDLIPTLWKKYLSSDFNDPLRPTYDCLRDFIESEACSWWS